MSSARRDRSEHGGLRVMAAEDNPVNRFYIERLLTRSGHDVSVAVDGREALRLHDAETFDLILMDCQMPELDGFEATAEIRRREREDGVRPTPIVAMTAGAHEAAREECLRAGMDDYLPKPVHEAALRALLERRLQQPVELLDPVRIAELQALFPGERASAMWSELTGTMTADLDRIALAIAADDAPAVAKAAHRIRGSAAMIGAQRLVDATTVLEDDAKRADVDGRSVDRTAVAELEWCWSAARAAIEARAEHVATASAREGERRGH